LPRALVQKIRLNRVDVQFIANDLFTFTKYTGADPEIQIGNDPGFIGVDGGANPRGRGYTLGINIGF
jgi:hypothetical protein